MSQGENGLNNMRHRQFREEESYMSNKHVKVMLKLIRNLDITYYKTIKCHSEYRLT